MLLIEDSEEDAQLLVRELRRGGFDLVFEHVETAGATSAALRTKEWDAILCDYKLPDFSPSAAIQLLREIGLDLPFIVVSGTIGEERAAELMREGAHDLVLKDNLARLVPALARELDEAENRRALKVAEAALGESRMLLKAFCDHVPTEFFIKDTDGRCLLVNREVANRYDVTEEEARGKTVHEIYPQAAASQTADEDRRVIETRKAVISEEQVHYWGAEHTNLVVRFPVLNEAGEVSRIGVIATDITDRKQAEQQHRDSEARLRAIMDNAADAIITIDEGGVIESVNRVTTRLFGYELDELVGQKITVLMTEPQRGEHHGYVANYLRTGKAKILGVGPREVTGQCKDGTTIPIELAINEMQLGGQRFFVGSVRDLTKRKAVEAQYLQAQKMESIGQLTGGIAHDFNNLLTVIQGNLELMREDLDQDSDADAIELMGDALSAVRDGSELAHHLLAFSRKQSLNPTRIDINELLMDFSRLMRRMLGQNIDLKIVRGDDVSPILADRGQVENAILNLAVNAGHAMPDGGTLTIATGNERIGHDETTDYPGVGPGDYVAITVSDTGTGMSPEVLKHALEPFYTTKETGKGSGLGLSMVHGFAKQSGGGIHIRSEVEKGTDIAMVLPVAPTGAHEEVEGDGPDEIAGGSETILVVEDEPRIRRFAIRCLEGLGYRVLEAENAIAALRILEGGASVDLMFSDIVMPGGMNGRELAKTVAEAYPGIKIQLATGFSKGADDESQGDDERYPALKKPYSKAQLARRIRKVLDADG